MVTIASDPPSLPDLLAAVDAPASEWKTVALLQAETISRLMAARRNAAQDTS